MDTSIIVKLYIREKYSREVSTWLRANNEAIPLTSFHELEFINVIHLKIFRNEAPTETIRQVISRFEEHEKKGIFYRPALDWSAVFILAVDLSKKHSANIGSRTPDIFHVASALSIHSDSFLTLDERQAKLAAAAGLKMIDFFSES